MDDTEYYFVGEAFSRMKPGFSTPVFQSRHSNGLWIQRIGKHDKIIAFIQIDEGNSFLFLFEHNAKFRRVGLKAFYCYHDSRGNVHVNTRGRLVMFLRSELARLDKFLYLQRTIARFRNDKSHLQYINLKIAEAERARRARRRKNPFVELDAEQADRSQLLERFVRTEDYDRLRQATERYDVTILASPRGYGKTINLIVLSEELKQDGFETYFFNLQRYAMQHRQNALHSGSEKNDTISSLVKSLAKFGQPAPNSSTTETPLEVAVEKLKENRSTVILLDDADVLFEGSDIGFETLKAIAGSELKFVLGCHGSNEKSLSEQVSGSTVALINLSGLSQRNVFELLKNYADDQEDRYLWNLVNALSTDLSGVTFRDILSLLSSATDERNSGNPIALSRLLDEILDRRLTFVLENDDDRNALEVKEALVTALDSIAVASNPNFEFENSLLTGGGYQPPPGMKSEFERLCDTGILVKTDDRRYEFSNAAIRDRWLQRRNLSSRRKR